MPGAQGAQRRAWGCVCVHACVCMTCTGAGKEHIQHVCMFMCASAHVSVGACASVHVWRPKVDIWIILSSSSTEEGFAIKFRAPDGASLKSQPACSGGSWSPPFEAELLAGCHSDLAFVWVLGV